LLKQSSYRPEEFLRASEVEAPTISRKSAHEDEKVVSPTHRPPLPSQVIPLVPFMLETESDAGPYSGRK